MKIILTAEFVSHYDDLPEKIQIKAEKQEKYFRKKYGAYGWTEGIESLFVLLMETRHFS